MMSRSKIPLLLLIALVGLCAAYEAKDDEARKASCGFSELPIHDASDKEKNGSVSIGTSSFLVKVYTVYDNGTRIASYAATGSFVSPTHVITSAQAALTDVGRWLLDSEPLAKQCQGDTHMKVPEEYVRNLRVVAGACADDSACETSERKVKSAYFLNMCDIADQDMQFTEMMRAMVLEMEATAQLDGYPCIADVPIDVKAGDPVRLYGFEYQKNIFVNPVLNYRSTKISNKPHMLFWLVAKYISNGDRGGPMLGFYEGRWFLLGIGASPAVADNKPETYFFKTKTIAEALCVHFKICGRTKKAETLPPRPATTAPPPTTTIKIHEATTTKKATTAKATTFALPITNTNAAPTSLKTDAPTDPSTNARTIETPIETSPESEENDESDGDVNQEIDGAVRLGVWSGVLSVALFLVL